MAYICFAIGLAILALAGFFAWKNRNDTSKWIFCILIGIFFSIFSMILPTEWVKAGKELSTPTLYTLISSLFYSFKTLGGGQEITQLETMPLPDLAKSIYIVFNYLVFVTAPVLTSGLLLSFFGDMGGKMQYAFRFSPKSTCYVFSETNENSLALAKGIKSTPGRKTLVFCSTKKVEKDLLAQAKALGAILLYKSCKDIKVSWRFLKYEFCLISACEDNNIELTEAIIAKNDKLKKHKIIINAFVESGTNVKFLEDVVSKNKEKLTIELRCIDEIALFCNDLVFRNPLYRTKNHGNHISVAIIGCGRTGMRMLKTVYWAGQIDGYTLKIRVYDKNADKVREKFYQQCPGLKGEKTIQFVKADVDTLDFKEKMLEKDNSLDATYIVVTMGDDQLNFSMADELYKIYRRSNSFDDKKMPEIFARVRSNLKSQSYFNNAVFLNKRNIHLFGTTESIFSEKTLFNSELENLAFAVHLAYNELLQAEKGTKAYEKAYLQFKTSEYDRRSSMAVALHIPAKLHMCDADVENVENIFSDSDEIIKKLKGKLETYANRISDCKELERMARNEHDRWNAFSLSEGYQPASIEEMLQYCKSSKKNRDDLSMLHACITDWESLDNLSKTFNSACGKNEDFKSSDEKIIKNIPSIIQKARNMKG